MAALPSAMSRPPDRRGFLALFSRHQVAAVLATIVDFGVMALLVEVVGLRPFLATLGGATAGAFTNFQLGRHWIFAAREEGAAPQALRYALVSGASAGLNALGEYAMHDVLGVDYLPARAVIAVSVSVLWNFPMHRRFVFRRPRSKEDLA